MALVENQSPAWLMGSWARRAGPHAVQPQNYTEELKYKREVKIEEGFYSILFLLQFDKRNDGLHNCFHPISHVSYTFKLFQL
jgi:hypothetical protein